MSKVILSNKLDFAEFDGRVNIGAGGTGADDPDEAKNNLNFIGTEDRNAANGVAGLDGNEKIYIELIPDALLAGGGLNGPAEVTTGSVTNYTIAGYSVFVDYTLSVSAGSAVRNGDTITFTAPATVQTATIVLNDRPYEINVVAPTVYVNAPSITSPVAGSNTLGASASFASSTFSMTGGSDTHEGSDWQIATDANFINIVAAVTNSAVNKTSWTASGLQVSTTYYVRVRYKGATTGYGAWSPVVNYGTRANFFPSIEESMLSLTDPVASDMFGNSIDLSNAGDYAIVGAAYKNSNGYSDGGAVDIYNKSGATWTKQARLVASSDAATMSLSIPSGGSIRVVITGAVASDNTYTTSQNITIPAGTTSISLTGTGGTGTTTTNPGQAYIAPSGWVTPVYAWQTNSSTQYTVQEYYNQDTGAMVGYMNPPPELNGAQWSPVPATPSSHPSNYTHVQTSNRTATGTAFTTGGTSYTTYSVTMAFTQYSSYLVSGGYYTNPGQPYIAPSTTYTTGTSATVTYASQTYTFAGGYGGPATASTQSAIMLFGSDLFGTSVTIDSTGTYAAVGARNGEMDGSSIISGVAYVFVRTGSTWSIQQKVRANDATPSAAFGSSVAINGDGTILMVGASGDDSNKGAAYVFTRAGSTWTQQQKIAAGDGAATNYFGESVAINGDGTTAVIGAKTNGTNGASYIFTRGGSVWSQQARLTPSDGTGTDNFGWSVAISNDGNTVAIGAPKHGANDTGAVYIFTRSGTIWSQVSKLTGSDTTNAGEFGYSVTMSNDAGCIIITAYKNTTDSTTGAGAAYLFSKNGAAWTQESKLAPAVKAANDNFGYYASISGNAGVALISATNKDISSNADAGAVYTFV